MLRCVCLVKCLVIGGDRELKAKTKTKTTTTSTAKNMIRISKTTTLHECITPHCSSRCRRSQPQNNSFRFLLFSSITFLCLESFLISPLSNREHTETPQSGENICDTFCSCWRCLCSTQGNMVWRIVNSSPPAWRVWTTLRRVVQGELASGEARRPGRMQQLIINR